MRRFLSCLLVLVAVMTLSATAHADSFATDFHYAKPPRPIPPIVFQDAGGVQHTLADYRGQFVLLNIWATWCGPCVKEMPSLQALQNRLGTNRLVVLPISEDRNQDVVRAFYHRHALNLLPVAVDPAGTVAMSLHLTGIPMTLLINPQGQEIGRLEGDADWNSPAAVAIILSELNASTRL